MCVHGKPAVVSQAKTGHRAAKRIPDAVVRLPSPNDGHRHGRPPDDDLGDATQQ